MAILSMKQEKGSGWEKAIHHHVEPVSSLGHGQGALVCYTYIGCLCRAGKGDADL
jgi:hypothetical protein